MTSRIFRFFALLYCSWVASMTQAQHTQWANALGNGNLTRIWDLEEDQSGNVVALGSFTDSIDLDPGVNVQMFYSNSNLFLAKYSATGQYLWGFVLESVNLVGCRPVRLSIDQNNNIFLVGFTIIDTVDLDPGPNAFVVPSNVNTGFIAKYSPSGSFLWGHGLYTSGPAESQFGHVETDASGNVYTTGRFKGSIDFAPGPATNILTATGLQYDLFLAKYSNSGTLLWAFNLGNATSGLHLATSLHLDAHQNVYVGGAVNGILDADPGPGTYNIGYGTNVQCAFFAKYTASGQFVWARDFKPSYNGNNEDVKAIAIDTGKYIYLTGNFLNTTDFNPLGGSFLMTAATTSMYMAKYDTSGNFLWAFKVVGGAAAVIPGDIAISPSLPIIPTIPDLKNLIYVVGTFHGPADFDPGAGTFNMQSLGTNDAFVAIYTADSMLYCAYPIAADTPYFQMTRTIYVKSDGGYYVGGEFGQGTADFNPYSGAYPVISKGYTDAFLSKYQLDTTGACHFQFTSIKEVVNPAQLQVYPNPSQGSFVIKSGLNALGKRYWINDVTGRLCLEGVISSETTAVNTQGWDSGVYFLKAEVEGVATQKIHVLTGH